MPGRANISDDDLIRLAAYRSAVRRVERAVQDAGYQAGVTLQQYQLLLALKGLDGQVSVNVTYLAEALQLDHQSVVGLLDRCEERGLVVRSPSEEDRRQVRIGLTEQGRLVLCAVAQQHMAEVSRWRRELRPPLFARPPRRPASANGQPS